VLYHASHKYGTPPMNTAHDGGVFTTRSLAREAAEARPLAALNREVITTFGLVRGVTHTEFIRAHEDGRWYFLETSARVGGAFIVDTIEAATGLNLWEEWAKIETADQSVEYAVTPHRDDYAGIVLSLARQEHPDMSAYTDAEIVTRLKKSHHAGLIVRSPDRARIDALIADYTPRFYRDFFATAPPPDRPVE
jgi:hypothetical protein